MKLFEIFFEKSQCIALLSNLIENVTKFFTEFIIKIEKSQLVAFRLTD